MINSKVDLAPKRRFRIDEWIGVLILLSLLVWFLLWPAFQNVRDSFSAHTWPTTKGKVTTSSKSKYTDGGARTSVNYRFRYEYQVKNKTYTGWRYSLSTPSGSQSAGVRSHQKGKPIEVHYHPKHPARSVINVESSSWWNYVVLGVMLFIGFVAYLASSRRRLSPPQPVE